MMPEEDITTYEMPEEMTYERVMYWEPNSKLLLTNKKNGEGNIRTESATLLTKAKKFLIEGCIQQITPTTWKCLPIQSYNKTTYTIRSTEIGMDCNCQGFMKKERDEGTGFCSHILATIQYQYVQSYNNQKRGLK